MQGADANIRELYDSLDAFLPAYFGFINPVLHRYEGEEGALNENQIKVLMAIRKTGIISQAEISDVFMIPRTSLTTVTRSLEARGLVRRETVGADRRSHGLALTDAGHALLDRKREENLRELGSLFADLSPAEATAVIRGFRTMEAYFSRGGFNPCMRDA